MDMQAFDSKEFYQGVIMKLATMKSMIFLAAIFLVACATTRNVSPPATLVPPSLSKEEAEFAIILSLSGAPQWNQDGPEAERAERILAYAFGEEKPRRKHWFYEGRGPNLVYAGFRYRAHYMRAEIKYSETEVTFKIVDSRGLRQSGNSIHKMALKWLGSLERDVRITLGAYDRVKYEQEMRANSELSESAL